jgi:hypothetical protein
MRGADEEPLVEREDAPALDGVVDTVVYVKGPAAKPLTSLKLHMSAQYLYGNAGK